MLQQKGAFMAKAFRDEAVVNLPRVSNNTGHGSFLFGPQGEIFSGY